MQTNSNSPLRHVSFVEEEVRVNKYKQKRIPVPSRMIPTTSSNYSSSRKRRSILFINKYNDEESDLSDNSDEEVEPVNPSWIKRLFQYKKKKTRVAASRTALNSSVKKEEGEAEEEQTISESTQKAIYELSRLKLTNPKRPLQHIVVVSNFLLQCT